MGIQRLTTIVLARHKSCSYQVKISPHNGIEVKKIGPLEPEDMEDATPSKEEEEKEKDIEDTEDGEGDQEEDTEEDVDVEEDVEKAKEVEDDVDDLEESLGKMRIDQRKNHVASKEDPSTTPTSTAAAGAGAGDDSTAGETPEEAAPGTFPLESEPLHLLVDLPAFIYFLREQYEYQVVVKKSKLPQGTPPSLISVLGGEYAHLHDDVKRIMRYFQDNGIRLVFFDDPPYGAEVELDDDVLDDPQRVKQAFEASRKFNTWRERFVARVISQRKIEGYCRRRNRTLPESVPSFPLLLQQVRHTLATLGYDIIPCLREADLDIIEYQREKLALPAAKAFLERHGVPQYVVISADSDFFVLRGCVYSPLQLLDINTRKEIFLRVFTPESVARGLHITPDNLIDLPLLCGNDITAHYVFKYEVSRHVGVPWTARTKSGVARSDMPSILKFLRGREAGPLEDHPYLQKIMAEDPACALAFVRSRRFYSGTYTDDLESESLKASPTLRFVEEKIRAHLLPLSAKGFFKRVVWANFYYERLGREEVGLDSWFVEIRRAIYGFLRLPFVVEYTRRGGSVASEVILPRVDVPTIEEIFGLDEPARLALFTFILDLGPGIQRALQSDKHDTGRKTAAVLLRMLAVQNTRHPKHPMAFTLPEFEALAASFVSPAEEFRRIDVSVVLISFYFALKREGPDVGLVCVCLLDARDAACSGPLPEL